MVQLGEGLRFFAEAPAGLFVGQSSRRQDFDGYVPSEVQILSAVDFAHPTRADFLQNTVVAECLINHSGNPLMRPS